MKQLRQTWLEYLTTTKANSALYLRIPARHISKVFGSKSPSQALRALTPMRLPKEAKRRLTDELTTLTDDWGDGRKGNHECLHLMHENGVGGYVSLGDGKWVRQQVAL